jgi:DNA-binding beta-propeller fold protein YncE
MLVLIGLLGVLSAQEPPETVQLRKLVASSPRLAHKLTEFRLDPPLPLEMVSSAAVSAKGEVYILQRGKDADPVIVASRGGKVLRSWGRGLYTIPHSVRIDPEGNVWTTDAGDSTVRKFTPAGKELMLLRVELPAKPKGAFCGATDIAFARDGSFYVSDGYQNTRVLHYSREGKRIREWGTPGDGPGQLAVPHGIAVDPKGRVYVADRENGRIQWFTPEGKWLGMWNIHGKTFCLKFTANGELWIGTQPRNVPNGAEGWLMKIDPADGRVLGLIESFGHSIDVTPQGEVLTGRRPGSLLVYRP